MLQGILPPEERVIEAVVARYQRVAPAVTRFARSLAGNEELRVRLGSRASAGPDEIVLDPGVFQAAYARNAPVTPTEVALTSALHEAIHLIATDFEERRPLPASWLAHRRTPSGAPAPSPAGEPDQRRQGLDPFDLFGHGGGADDDVDFDDPDGAADLGPGAGSGFADEFGDVLADGDALEQIGQAIALDDPFATGPSPGGATNSGAGVSDQVEPTFRLLDALVEIGGDTAEGLFLAIEDARQERRYFAGYGGARSVLTDIYRAAVADAIKEARALGQYALACFMLVGDYLTRDEVQRQVVPSVAGAVDDAMPFIAKLHTIDNPWDVGTVALQLLEIARLHGLVSDVGAHNTATNRLLADEADRAAISQTVDAVRITTPMLQDGESYEDTRQAAQSVSAEAGRHGEADHAGDPATDQVVRVSESPTVYLPTGQSGKLVVTPFPERFRMFAADGRQLLEETARQWAVAQRRVSGELYPLFLANQRRGLRSGYDAGDLSPYAALLLGAGVYDRMFERRDLPMRRSYAVSLLVDGSASMLQSRSRPGGRTIPWALSAATLGAWTLAHLCNELQIEFEVALFNRAFAASVDDTERSFETRRHQATGGLRRTQGGSAERLTRTVNHYLLKPFDARWRGADDTTAGLFWAASRPAEAAKLVRSDPDDAPPVSLFDKAANVDEFNVAYAASRLAQRRVSTRILVVLADGMTRGSVESLAASVEAVEHGGTTVLGIGIGDTTVQAAYARHQVVERPDELAQAMVDGVRSSLYRTLAAVGGQGAWLRPTAGAGRR